MRYIGSKGNLLEEIEMVMKDNINENVKSFMDIFSGTGVVGEYFKKNFEIMSNDILYFSYILQKAKIENNTIPRFLKLKKLGIEDPSYYLENKEFTVTKSYFATKHYSPYLDGERMYFTVENANRIDFIRLTIEQWKNENLLNEKEYTYLLAILIEAVPFVSNIGGTYGAYLKHWDKRALRKLKLRNINVVDNGRKNRCYNDDANEIVKKVEGDVLYIDPPYNRRQYISNYHVLETIARYDSPEIYGKTALRPYNGEKSKYCLKGEVLDTFEELIKNAKFKHIVVSYSSDGLLKEEDIERILINNGNKSSYKLYKFPYRKYKSKHKQESNALYEYLFYINKDIKQRRQRPVSQIIKISSNSCKSKSYIKSPLNYIGGKYKLLKQIIPIFPENIDNFVDLFAGGFNVGINVKANKIYANDINTYVIDILRAFNRYETQDIISHIKGRIKEFGLSKTNEDGFLKFRELYNQTKNPLDLYTLICYSFNYQFRFNNNHQYNNPFGRNRSQFSNELKQKLLLFTAAIKHRNIEFSTNEFDTFNFSTFGKNDLVYCDPPYLITTGSYNDGDRGFKNWNEKQEVKLLELLDNLNMFGIRFALSNVLNHKGESNDILIEWSKKYKIHYLNHNYSNSSHNTRRGESKEVMITNY